MQTFFADGNYIETNNNIQAGSTGHGVWIGSGNTYLYTFQVFTFDEHGKYDRQTRHQCHDPRWMAPIITLAKRLPIVIDVEGNVTQERILCHLRRQHACEVELPELK